MKKIICLLTSITVLAGIMASYSKKNIKDQVEYTKSVVDTLNFNYKVNPETFEIIAECNGKEEVVSKAMDKREVSNLKQDSSTMSWTYPNEGIQVNLKKEKEYIDVKIKSTKDDENEFTWPKVEGENYILPLGEGKSIPKNDDNWMKYLNEKEIDVIQSFSMGFFAVNYESYSAVYLMDDMFNDSINFDTKQGIEFSFNHEYTKINKDKDYGFRIYFTQNNPVDISKVYRNYVIEKGEFKTLEEKAKDNKNIEKLYGATHMYLWDTTVISEKDINWDLFRKSSGSKPVEWIKTLLKNKIEDSTEKVKALEEVGTKDYVDKYNKNTICQGLSDVLTLPDFYNEEVFPKKDAKMEELLKKGSNNLNQVEIIDLNKRALNENMEGVFMPVEQWASDRTTDLLKDIKDSGLDNAWIGLDNWTQGFIKTEMVKYANDNGYLIGPYDSYHSIHEPGKEQWNTAEFEDKTLYENATVTDKKGKKLSGFQNVGRKLNPTLSMPSVEERVKSILNTGVNFNSWFIDCDATGEVYDDYSKDHITTQKEDLKARLDRMAYIGNDKNMVIGSEGGNDFASSTIAFAHGIEIPAFSWMDDDMKKNKDSKYYLGRYYSPNGGVPEKYSKEVPVKEEYKKIFLDNTYNVPLFKLVYNDSVITTYQWEWSTLKIKDEVKNRMLYEILYNVPSLYHLDKFQWEEHGTKISEHSKVWSKFSKEVINKEMTDFKVLSENKLVQMTQYGDDIKVVCNFSNKNFKYNDDVIEGQSLIIYRGDKKEVYKPGE